MVRRKLGYVDPDEARRISSILGGEIGVEKNDADLRRESFYNQGTRKHKNNIDVIDREAALANIKFEKISKPENMIESQLSEMPSKKGMSYMSRIKTDLMCTKPEFRIKTLRSAIGAFFSFLFPLPDNVNPVFITELDKTIYKPIADLVKATRGLYTKTRDEVYASISANPLYAKILKTIKAWDIESIELEILHLKKRIKGQPMRNMLRLCKMVYIPIMHLFKLDEIKHILSAYKWAYNINIKSAFYPEREKEKLISFYYDAEKNLPYVLNNIKRMLYPFLLKRVSITFQNYEEFFITERDKVMNFLGITEDMLLEGDIGTSMDTEDLHSTAPPPIEEVQAPADEIPSMPESVQKGLSCLEKLYPKAGWHNLAAYPDLYPYFHPVFNYPSGFELIPPTDPLHQLVVLLSILNDLFYGFRNLKFGSLLNKEQEAQNIQSDVDSLINYWPLYIDEIIAKVYISRLTDYCRQIEKDTSFKTSEVGKKIITEMNWVKKNYLLPYLSFKLHTQIVGIIKRQLPRLSELTTSLNELLSQVVAELKLKADEGAKPKCDSISNPWASYIFDLENNTSRRLGKLLHTRSTDEKGKIKMIDRRNNANLLFYTTAILSVLDYFINNKESHLYFAPSQKIYRSIDKGSDAPQRTVQTINPDDFLKELPSLIIDNSLQSVTEPTPKEPVPLKELIELKILQSKKSGSLFSIIYLSLIREAASWDHLTLTIINDAIHKESDNMLMLTDTSLLLILENSDMKHTISLAKALVREIGKEQVATGVLQFQPDWSYSYFLKVLDKIKLFTAKQGPAKLVCLDLSNNKFRSFII